ncbi:MAG: phage/plasmid primase, P4 family [Candidatus Bathyarchaeota archaeon]|nr:phage/plasmid primase, P4 family [Candidatus Bathyarchaeota archaeon]
MTERTITSDVPSGMPQEPLSAEAVEWRKNLKKLAAQQQKSYPCFAQFCDEPEHKVGFKPARVAKWLSENENFKTDRKTDMLYYGDAAKGVWTANGEVKLQEILAVILGEENRVSYYTNILHALKALTYCDIEFSRKIAVENGLLNVETGELTPFTLEEMAFYALPVAYNAEAQCPNWLEFLKQVVAQEDIPTLQEWSGYLLLPDYRFHNLTWIYGGGRNGKGVWQRTMEGILGAENVSSVALEEFDGSHRFAMRQLYGKLFNPCSEPTTNRVLQTALLKKATGQDTISAECKGKDKRIDFRNVAKITVIANKFPKVRDTTTAFKERRLFIKFPNEFTGKNVIANLEQIWLGNAEERSGILNWMLQGLQRLLSQGYFTESKSQEETEIAFERASDTISAFLNQIAIFDKNLVTTRAEAYNAYKEYCDVFGLETENEKVFTQRLKETPRISVTTVSKPNRLRAWKGLGLRKLNDDGSVSPVSDVSLQHGVIPQANSDELSKNRESISHATSDTGDTSQPLVAAKDCVHFHKASCMHPNPNCLTPLFNCPSVCRDFKPYSGSVTAPSDYPRYPEPEHGEG